MPEISRLKLFRLIDANANRAKEGLRVCEDICRFYFDKEQETLNYKEIRHRLTQVMTHGLFKEAIAARQVAKDVGRTSTKSEFTRRDINDVFYANSQRVKESLRVLEECAKLLDITAAKKFKGLRYDVYELEGRLTLLKR
jgi:hypothetical protein